MKAGIFAASAAALLQVAVAQPHGHRHQHEKRDVVEYTTTLYAPEVIVYVDDNGNTIGTTTLTVGSASTVSTSVDTSATTTSSSSASTAPSSSVPTSSSTTPVPTYVESTSSIPSSTPSTTAAAATSSAASSSAPAASSSASSSGGSSSSGNILTSGGVKGVTFSPYEESGDCYTQSKVQSSISSLASEGFNAIRLYGVDCNQVGWAAPAAKSAGMAVIAGIFDVGSVQASLNKMKSQLGGDFSSISGVSVYNEVVNNGQLSASDVADAVNEAKSFLKSTNFDGVVFAVDTFNTLLKSANSAIIEASDIVAANCHGYFDTTVDPSGAGDYVQTQISNLEGVANGKPVLITESGWVCHDPAGSSRASNAAQSTAMSQLKAMNLFAFTPTSTAWHKTPDSVENYWGWGTC
ncbi:putative cell wall glucanase [Phaeomoniella chlamydospora]|uniref:Putative cell wall glucanase n=1 Tax=Phaeomoniella chlamydospora TaxID=158046 RepID=A0A0G2HFX5_PHACM|nr:putative cell wall glucanase [Phaeomoniella chlamydospora]